MSVKVRANRVLSIGEYLEMATGRYYHFGPEIDSDIDAAEKIINQAGLGLGNHNFTEIDKIFENDLTVVLVDCLEWNEEKKEYDHILRWFEVPEH